MRHLETRTGARFPVLGLGTWELGVQAACRAGEVAALQLGFDLGMTLVDTAEMYADGGAEEVVGEALRGRREQVFVTTKVLPENASETGTERAAERSLRRLGTDWIDLYLLHWIGSQPFEATLAGFERLRHSGKIRHYGVSNFDLADLAAIETLPAGGGVAVNQVYYNLQRRGIEHRILPWCRERGIAVQAYSPLDQGRLKRHAALQRAAEHHGVRCEQIALAWAIREPGVQALVKAADPEHVRRNARAADLVLDAEEMAALDRAYPRPHPDAPLETL